MQIGEAWLCKYTGVGRVRPNKVIDGAGSCKYGRRDYANIPRHVVGTVRRVLVPAAGPCAPRGTGSFLCGAGSLPQGHLCLSPPASPLTPLSPHPRIGSARPWGHRTLSRRWLGTSEVLPPLAGARPRLAHIGLLGAVLPVPSPGRRTPLSLPAPALEGCSELQKKNKSLKLKLCGKAAREAVLCGNPLCDRKRGSSPAPLNIPPAPAQHPGA